MRIWHISDTHTYHGLLSVPENIDVVLFSGDCSIPRDIYKSEFQIREFLLWMWKLPIKHKIFVAGNHDFGIEKNLVKNFEDYDVIYLENDSVTIDGIKFWGSPFTPSFGNWGFGKSRSKIHKVWDSIPDDSDVIVTHGPPKGILDISNNHDNSIEFCGDSSLKKRMFKLEPILVCFGHIHNYRDHINAGSMKLSGRKTIYSNGSVVTDGKFGKLSSNGNIFEIDSEKNIKIID